LHQLEEIREGEGTGNTRVTEHRVETNYRLAQTELVWQLTRYKAEEYCVNFILRFVLLLLSSVLNKYLNLKYRHIFVAS